jgi:hypothetical protein
MYFTYYGNSKGVESNFMNNEDRTLPRICHNEVEVRNC